MTLRLPRTVTSNRAPSAVRDRARDSSQVSAAAEIAPGIYSLGQFMGGFVHAYLLDDGESLTLIDTLFDEDAHRILDLIRGIGKEVTDVKRIILSHAHRSHLGGLARLKLLTGAPVYAHDWEEGIISGKRKAEHVPWAPSWPYVTWPMQVALNLGMDKHPYCDVDRNLQDGDQVGPIQVLQTPGHTPGHVAFYWPERRALFAGDAFITWPELAAGWPGFMLDFDTHLTSVRRMAALDFEVLATGHGDPIATGAGQLVRALLNGTGPA